MRHFTTPDGCRLAYEVEGNGPAVLWQHGLGATAAQPAEVFPQGFQRITLLCRGHEGSALGDPARLTIAQFTEDALALLTHLDLPMATIGGISLGAAIALRLAILYPGRARALILARPAWTDSTAPDTLRAYLTVAERLAAGDTAQTFTASATYRSLHAASPDNAASISSFFTRPRPETTIALLQRIPLDGPGVSAVQIARLTLPTLVLTTTQDHVHPAAMGQRLAALIPGATLTDLPPKAPNKPAHVAQFRAALTTFLASLP